MNKILVINSPHVPSYFNAGHRLPIFQVGNYLRKNCKDTSVKCLDIAALNYTWKEIGDILFQGKFDLIAIMLDYDSADNFERLLKYIYELSFNSKVLVYGRLCKQNPDFFKKYKISAIIRGGDDEIAILRYWKYILGQSKKLVGCSIFQDGKWMDYKEKEYLSVENWVFPDISEIPYDKYMELYKNDSNKFCGIPNKKELVIQVSRGCPIGCKYCDVTNMQGCTDRRLEPNVLFDYIIENFKKYSFNYVSMYSAIFTLNDKWVKEFCSLLMQSNTEVPWKCVTTIEHLTIELIEIMAKANCIRISIGVETLFQSADNCELPVIKRNTLEKVIRIAKKCKDSGIELNCFVMLGIPGITYQEAQNTIQTLMELGVRIRPTVYTPYYKINKSMSLQQLSDYNRQIFENSTLPDTEKDRFYEIIFGRH